MMVVITGNKDNFCVCELLAITWERSAQKPSTQCYPPRARVREDPR
jgi:hypothetical protein